MKRLAWIFILTFCFCDMPTKTIDVQGHRGCRGLMPENTVPAFLKALELGVTTLEMDLVISKDHQVIVSHEPFFRAPISMGPDGIPVSKEDEKNHNLYAMSYDTIAQYDMGLLEDPNHPARANISAPKPRLKDVVDAVRVYCEENNVKFPFFNMEIKREPEHDSIFHPDAGTFVDLVMNEVQNLGMMNFTTIQSFDLESLRLVRERYSGVPVALLIANQQSVEENISALGFKPEIYSCYFQLVNEALIEYCRSEKIRVIPWTVNEEEDIQRMIDLEVDGIISDYPDRVLKLL